MRARVRQSINPFSSAGPSRSHFFGQLLAAARSCRKSVKFCEICEQISFSVESEPDFNGGRRLDAFVNRRARRWQTEHFSAAFRARGIQLLSSGCTCHRRQIGDTGDKFGRRRQSCCGPSHPRTNPRRNSSFSHLHGLIRRNTRTQLPLPAFSI